MADVMVDSSAWIDYFRHSEGAVGDCIHRLLIGSAFWRSMSISIISPTSDG